MRQGSLMPKIWLKVIKNNLEKEMPQEYKILERAINEMLSEKNLASLDKTSNKNYGTHYND